MVSVNSPTAVSPRTSAKLSGSTLPSPASIDAKQAALKRALSAAPFLARTEGDFAASSRIPSMAAIPDDLALALELADLADMITLRRYRADDLVVETKPDLTPVTEADRDTERALREQLTIARPADSVIGEEYGVSTAPDSTRRWILDPIDGTKNYVRGIPVWATLIALEEDGRGTVGVVSAPALHRRWWGAAGGGAFVSDGLGASPEPRRIEVSGVRELADAQLGLSGWEEWEQAGRGEPMLELTRRCWRSRGFGDFWGYMLVAEGALDVDVDPVVSLWDLAASLVIVREAGGRLTDLGGRETAGGGDVIASNGLLHDAALAIIGR
jgi:histidinol-phosphatase